MQKAELQLIIETIPDAVTIIDRNGIIVYVNSAAERILGLKRSEIQARPYNAPSWKITTTNNQPFPEEELPFNQVIKSKKPVYGIVLAFEQPDSAQIILSVNAAPLLDKNGDIEFVMVSLTDITEQRKAAEEVRESRRQVLDILESITDAFYALDNDWRFTYVNRRAEELFGIRREQLLFRNIWKVIRKEQSPEIYKKYHQAKDNIAPIVFEDYSDRIKKWLEMHVYPYRNGISVYIRDITDRKRVEEALKKQLAINLAVFNQAVANLALMNLNYRFVQVNQAYAAYFSKKPEDLEGDYIFDYVAADLSNEEIKETFDSIVRSKKAANFKDLHFIFRNQPGRGITYWDSTVQPIFDENGDVEFLLLVAVETTERKQAEDALKASEQKYRELFEESLDGISITSPEGKIIDINKKAVKTFGYDSKDEVMRLDLARDVYADPKDRKRILNTVNKQGSGEFDVVMKKKSGERFIAHIAVAVAKDGDGRVTSYRVTMRDILGRQFSCPIDYGLDKP
jgi:PAS domain S-box-containing protein